MIYDHTADDVRLSHDRGVNVGLEVAAEIARSDARLAADPAAARALRKLADSLDKMAARRAV